MMSLAVAAVCALLLLAPNAQTTPARIVSLVPAATEMLFAIDAGSRVVGVSSFDRFPPEVERIPRVGALIDPNVERILALRPDLVVVYRSQTDLRAQLERARIPTFIYVHAGLADVTATLRQLGDRVGRGDAAQRLATEIETRIEAVRARTRGRPRPRTLVVMSRDQFALRGIYASGGVGFVHDMLTAAGGENIFADVKREATQATSELIIARAPSVVLELHGDPLDAAAIAKERRVWDTLSSVPAVRTGRVHILADERTVVPGPRVAEGVELLAALLGK